LRDDPEASHTPPPDIPCRRADEHAGIIGLYTMAKPKPLTKKQQVFIDEYLQTWNAAGAARLAGYSERSAYSQGWENLRKPEIQAAIKERLDEVHMSADETLKRLADIARGDIADFLDVSPLGFTIDLAEAQAAGKTPLIKKIKQKTVTINGQKEDREIHTEEIELYSAVEALQLIGKHHKLFNEIGSKGNPIHIEGLDRLLDKVWS
jgi:phage terminase small subunit